MVLGIMLGNALLLISVRNYFPLIYSSDPTILRMASNIILFTAFVTIFDGMQSACSGVMRGVGHPLPGTIGNLAGFYGVGLPVGAGLAFGAKWGLYGIWVGLGAGILVVASLMLIFVLRIDWMKVKDEASRRTDTRFVELSEIDAKMEDVSDFSIDDDSDNKGKSSESDDPQVSLLSNNDTKVEES